MRSLEILRKKAKDTFERVYFPSEKDEEWKGISPLVFKPSEQESFYYSWEIKGGREELIRKGGRVVALEDFRLEDWNNYFSEKLFNNKFLAYNFLHMDGLLVFIPEKVFLTRVLDIVINVGQGKVSCPNIVVVADKESQAKVNIFYKSRKGSEVLFIGAEQFFIEDGAQLSVTSWQNVNLKSNFLSFSNSYLKKDSKFNFLAVASGGSFSKQFVYSELSKEGAEAKLFGVYAISGEQKCSFNTYQNHVGPNTKSDLLFKGVLSGSSSGIFRGLIKVYPNAQKTNAYQANRNLVLSKKARVDSLPLLEIEANDVRCTHGVTVGKINEEQLFYLKSRGISEVDAKKMIVEGFVGDVFTRAGDEELKNKVLKIIRAKIG